MYYLWAEAVSENKEDLTLVDSINKKIDEIGFNVAINYYELENATLFISDMIGDNKNVKIAVSHYPNILCV